MADRSGRVPHPEAQSSSPQSELFHPVPNSSAIVLADDIEEFGPDVALSLSELPSSIADLNRRYRRLVARRGLRTLPDMECWTGRPVEVFLRHDAVFVFAVATDDTIGMCNRVELMNSSLVVDISGRRQTLSQSGPLPNATTVHAFVQGIALSFSDDDSIPDMFGWEPVVYRPLTCETFVNSITGQPVYRAMRTHMTAGRTKVWCQGIHTEALPPAPSGDIR
jgi:hypothetical protein